MANSRADDISANSIVTGKKKGAESKKKSTGKPADTFGRKSTPNGKQFNAKKYSAYASKLWNV